MQCPNCKKFERRNVWVCPSCKEKMNGGIVFVTGISGSGVGDLLTRVVDEAQKLKCDVMYHDIGQMMRKHAEDDDPNVRWEWILDADEKALRFLRTLAFQELTYKITSNPDKLHLVDLHLSFRWKAYLMKGFEPHLLKGFSPLVRCFINVVQDLPKIQDRLKTTSWGEREILEILIWRDEELFFTDLFANACGRIDCYAVTAREPAVMIQQIIWHPETKKAYLSFPITKMKEIEGAIEEVEGFRDDMRKFLIVFDPYACRDYEETYNRPEMKALRKEVGETTEQRDYRFIDQADAVVVYYARKVTSQGVDAEMNHARRTGKPIFLYSPEDPGAGPFAVPPSHFRTDPKEFLKLLKEQLSPTKLT